MPKNSEPGTSTRERILAAARRCFAEKGFRATTVAEICRGAQANIAAVNYHFGGKEALYREAWQSAHQATIEAFPPAGGATADAPPEARLRGRIRGMLQRTLSEDGLEFRIMGHEMANPTGLLEQVLQDAVGPLLEALEAIIQELLGGHAGPDRLRQCAASVIGPCLYVMRRQRMQKSLGQPAWFDPEDLDALVEHFTGFALAGLEAARQRLEADGREDRAVSALGRGCPAKAG
ncbi:MAG: CerR family C-terminal domain-containing protein [Proteobacteria bacterium]|nr:CerR family C-terminal domain-containing protein [Pseudomonadota bacterium]